MKSLTTKEEEIMNHFWQNGEMKISELHALYEEPRPHVNTLSTLVKILEEKGFVAHKALSPRNFRYFAKVTKDGYRRNSLKDVVDKFFDKDSLGVVNTLVKDEKISLDELKELIKMVENQ